MAPFQGLTDKYLRNIILDKFGGIDKVFAPFVSGCGTSQISKSKLSDLLLDGKPLLKTVPQIISNDSREIILFGETLAKYGYKQINWNLGCPFRRIAVKAKGSGLLPYPGRIENILNDIFEKEQLSFSLSVKTRLGYNSTKEIFEVINILNKYPLSEVIIHPRTGKQLYKGNTNLDDFAKCVELSAHPVAYNGDIYNSDAFDELFSRFGNINHWMLGRGLLINPFLAEQIKKSFDTEIVYRERLFEFIKQLLENTISRSGDERKTTNHLKSVTYYMAGSFVDPDLVFSKIKKVKTTKEFVDVLNEIIDLPLSNNREKKEYFINGLKHL